MVFGANTYREFVQMLGPSTEELEGIDPWGIRMMNMPATVVSSTLEGHLPAHLARLNPLTRSRTQLTGNRAAVMVAGRGLVGQHTWSRAATHFSSRPRIAANEAAVRATIAGRAALPGPS